MTHFKEFSALRTGLPNSRFKFQETKGGRVAFLGGSITQSAGWRDGVMHFLRARFPGTRFEFLGAGIASLGSVPHAFRLESDVLSKGLVDLLFVEAAVNDTVNIPADTDRMRRGMEGIVRHARLANPHTDIVHLHFAMPEHLADFAVNRVPPAIFEHERVAEAYGNPSLNLSKEVFERIQSGEFTWDGDFRDLHPSPFGHGVYAAAIARFLEAAWSMDEAPRPHVTPPAPLDPASYFEGHFASWDVVHSGHGFKSDPCWRPHSPGRTRPGFVEVPALSATRPNAELVLDFQGTAVGLLVAAGPKSGVLEVSCDNEPPRTMDTRTAWSRDLYLPWTVILADALPMGRHTVRVRLRTDHNPPDAQLVICRILVNGPAREIPSRGIDGVTGPA